MSYLGVIIVFLNYWYTLLSIFLAMNFIPIYVSKLLSRLFYCFLKQKLIETLSF